MSIEKYLKSTPDYVIPNTSSYSTDGQNLRCYKLGNAGDIVGYDWCFATNYNDENRYVNTILGTSDSLETNKNGYITEDVDSNLYFTINKDNLADNYSVLSGGLCGGILYVPNDVAEADIHNCYVIENLDFNKVLLKVTAYGTVNNPVVAEKISIDTESDRVLNAGYLIEVNILTNNVLNTVETIGIRYVEYFASNGVEYIKPYYINARELQPNSRNNTEIPSVSYNNSPLSKPYYREQDGLTFNTPYWEGKHHIVTTMYPTDRYKLWEEFTRSTQYYTYYASYVTNHATVTDLTHLLNSSGLRYYDSDHNEITDIKNNVFIGVMDEDGVTDCYNRIKGWDEIEASDLPNKNRTGYEWDVVDPTKPPTPEPSDDIESVGYGYFSNTTIGTLYALHNKLDLEDITKWLLTQTDKIDVAKNVVSLKEIPFPVADLGFGSNDIPVRMGGITVTREDGSTLNATELVSPDIPTLNIVFADFDIPRLSNTFLDYSPYTQYELLLPFAPSPINLPDWCVGKNVKGVFLYDIYTTGCQYVVECNGERICSVSGNFGVDRPLMAQNVAVRDATRLSAQLSTASSVIGGVVSGVTGNVGGIMNGAINGISSISQSILANKQNYMYTTGANGDSSSIALYHAAHLKITRTLSNADENFEHIYGRPLLKIRKLSDVSGYTVCDNINVSGINCTNEEKEMIKALLETGVYL